MLRSPWVVGRKLKGGRSTWSTWPGGSQVKKFPWDKSPRTRSQCSRDTRDSLQLWDGPEGALGRSLLAADGDSPSGLRFGAESL